MDQIIATINNVCNDDTDFEQLLIKCSEHLQTLHGEECTCHDLACDAIWHECICSYYPNDPDTCSAYKHKCICTMTSNKDKCIADKHDCSCGIERDDNDRTVYDYDTIEHQIITFGCCEEDINNHRCICQFIQNESQSYGTYSYCTNECKQTTHECVCDCDLSNSYENVQRKFKCNYLGTDHKCGCRYNQCQIHIKEPQQHKIPVWN